MPCSPLAARTGDEPFPSDPEAVAAVRAAAQVAHRAAGSLASAPEEAISGALRAMAGRLGQATGVITAANEDDMRAAAEAGLTGALMDRLRLDGTRLTAMADSAAGPGRRARRAGQPGGP